METLTVCYGLMLFMIAFGKHGEMCLVTLLFTG